MWKVFLLSSCFLPQWLWHRCLLKLPLHVLSLCLLWWLSFISAVPRAFWGCLEKLLLFSCIDLRPSHASLYIYIPSIKQILMYIGTYIDIHRRHLCIRHFVRATKINSMGCIGSGNCFSWRFEGALWHFSRSILEHSRPVCLCSYRSTALGESWELSTGHEYIHTLWTRSSPPG